MKTYERPYKLPLLPTEDESTGSRRQTQGFRDRRGTQRPGPLVAEVSQPGPTGASGRMGRQRGYRDAYAGLLDEFDPNFAIVTP